ncbi:MAG: family 78 glycoside hydrolase catalytic domain [Candidatus Enterosoma sp.]|nr:glycoside hydrolase family 78 protein [Bacilli bacterium]MDY6063594.1 family 78 glycoside hydrolase catalytic domain [Candidatus Enterosoma sp.]
MKAIHIQTEYLTNPIGISFSNPTILWNCEGGKRQTAYQLKAYCGQEMIYDSNKVKSSRMKAELPLSSHSRDIITLKLTLFDENDQMGEETEAMFELGLLERKDFKGKWITGNYKVNKKKRYPVDCFKKEFDCNDVIKARLYITACGLYEAKINGKKAGTFVLAPGITNFKYRIQYQTIDVTSLLKDGHNQIEVELSDGIFRGSTGAWGIKNQYGTVTKLYAQLEMIKKDGTSMTIVTDESWNWSNDGPLTFADIQDGEHFDARKVPSYQWHAKVTKYDILPSSSNNVPLEEHETFKPTVIKTPSGKTVLDFHQNIAGYLSFHINGHAGDKIHLRFGETFTSNHEFTQKNIQCSNKKGYTSPLQEVYYTLKEGENNYKTKFAIFGFQYVLVETDLEINPEDFTAIAVYSSFEETLSFHCSNPLIEKLVESTRWSAKNNHADNPTDCPTRERHGWTGDAQIFANTAGYFFNYASFARKYERLLVDEQKKNGKYTQIVPSGGVDFYMVFMDGSSGWSDAGIMIPYRMWKLYGDEKIIQENYESMKKYAEFLINRIGKWYLTASPTGVKGKDKKYLVNYGQAYGEWAEPCDVYNTTWKDCAIPHPEVATAYTSYVLSLFAEIAEHLGKIEDQNRYQDIAEKVKKSYQALSHTEKFTLDTDRQARLVRPLYFHLLDEKDTKYAKERLIKALENYNWRVGTGFLSTPLILFVLEDINIEYAYRLLENEKMPGWLFMPKSGANTIWEAWEGNTTPNVGIASLDHYSKGAVCEWIFKEMCGVNVASENSFIIAPKVGGNETEASLTYQSVYGLVKSSWRKEKGKVIYDILIPSNTTAKIILPGKVETVDSGSYHFEIDL